MPIKKDKRKKKITLLKQKQKQKQSQQVVINLGDLMKKHKPRAKPLVPPKPKQPHELILTRVINPTVMPPYQHHNVPTPPVALTRDGLESPKYVPANYKPIVNEAFLERMGRQATPFKLAMEEDVELKRLNALRKNKELEDSNLPINLETPVIVENPLIQRRPRRRQDDPTLIAEKEARALRRDNKQLAEQEMQRRRENEAELMKRGGYKSTDQDE